MRAQDVERRERIGHVPGGLGAALRRKRLRENEQAVEKVCQAKARGHPKRQTETVLAEGAADSWPDDEAKAKSRSQQPEFPGPFSRGSNVGNVGKGSTYVGRGDAGDDSTNEKPAQRRRDGH